MPVLFPVLPWQTHWCPQIHCRYALPRCWSLPFRFLHLLPEDKQGFQPEAGLLYPEDARLLPSGSLHSHLHQGFPAEYPEASRKSLPEPQAHQKPLPSCCCTVWLPRPPASFLLPHRFPAPSCPSASSVHNPPGLSGNRYPSHALLYSGSPDTDGPRSISGEY